MMIWAALSRHEFVYSFLWDPSYVTASCCTSADDPEREMSIRLLMNSKKMTPTWLITIQSYVTWTQQHPMSSTGYRYLLIHSTQPIELQT